MWASGDYAAFAPLVAGVGERLVDRVGVPPGAAVLDVACGTGNVAIPAALAGGRVTGVDLTPEHFPAARLSRRRRGSRSTGSRATSRRCRSRTTRSTSCCRRSVACSRPATPSRPRSSRGCCARAGGSGSARSRPRGGRRLLPHARRLAPAPPPFAQNPLAWGDAAHVRELFAGLELAFEHASYVERFESLDHAVELYTTTFGPIAMLGGRARAGDLRAVFERHATDGGTPIPYDYLVTL